MRKAHEFFFDLQMFAEGEGAAESGLATTTEVASSGEGATGDSTPQGQEVPFADLIAKGGKYHKEYSQAVKDAVGKRFKNQSDNQAIIDKMSPLLQMVSDRYGIKSTDGKIDYEAIEKAISNDNSMYEQEAFDKGMDVEDLKRQKGLERENARLKAENERFTRQQEADREWANIMEQAKTLKQVYPNFDIDVEMENPTFGRLLATFQNSGFPDPLKTAYTAVHQDEIIAGSMQYAVQHTTENISKAIASGGMRPKENGTSARSSGNFDHTDPTRYKLKDFAELKRRAERGERITLD